uniref:Hyaluronidase n=1 Tax=Oreochromis niloticus TaxID=8128 RepID=A0A669C807_ORENI
METYNSVFCLFAFVFWNRLVLVLYMNNELQLSVNITLTLSVLFVQFDLVNTIGEAAALGAAGVVSWGDMNVTDTEDSCFDAQRHLEQVMNRYIVNVSTATRLCSDALCQGQGRRIRKHWDDDVFLHLDSHCYRIKEQHRGGPFTVSGGLSQDDINWFD